MARLWQSGFELNSQTALIEWDFNWGNYTSISSSLKRSGGYAFNISALDNGSGSSIGKQFSALDAAGPYFFRFYLDITTLPSADTKISIIQDNGGTIYHGIGLTTTGKLQLFDNVGQVGSYSAALSTGQWYMIEGKFDNSGGASHGIVEAKIDGTSFASSTTKTLSNVNTLYIGGNLTNDGAATFNVSYDDVAINDSTGASQTSYPGSGKIIHLKPSAAGDVNTFATQTGGTAGASNNYTRVDEIPPDDATSFNGSSTLNQEDLFNCDDSGIGASDTVNVVAIGGRFRNSTADTTGAFKFEVEKAASGTKTQSAAIIPNSTTWKTNAKAVPYNYPITTYADPDSAAWTQTTLDSMQIGYIDTANPGTAGRRCEITTVWASVDYTPAVAPPSSTFSGNRMLLGVGQ